MIHTRYFKLLVTLALGWLGWASQASAVVVTPNPPTATYTFVGNCEDCATENRTPTFPVWATLELRSYTPGTQIGSGQFFSFTYSGSNLFDPFSIAESEPDWFSSTTWFLRGDPFPSEGGSFTADLTFSGILKTGENFLFETYVGGGFNLSAGPPSSSCSSLDGDGQASVANDCVTFDYGTGTWQIPEPGSLALLGLALAGLGLTRRFKR